jgi:hypothetical protein
MKKIIVLFAGLLLFYSCLNTDDNQINFAYEILPIDSFTTPDTLTIGKKDTINIKYTLKNACYSFDNVYYEYQDTARIVAVRALVNINETCAEVTTEEDFNIVVTPNQTQDYVFKFFIQ